MNAPLFHSYQFGPNEKSQLDREGHFLFPGLLTEPAREELVDSLAKVTAIPLPPNHDRRDIPKHFAAEYDEYLASVIGHPQMLELAHSVLGEEIRFDHCVNLSLAGSSPKMNWHTHAYADDQEALGFIRIFFYVNGFERGDGNLRVAPGSHLFRRGHWGAGSDEELNAQLSATSGEDKSHPQTGETIHIEDLEVPEGSVIVMWTHALHAVAPRLPGSPMRWAVVYAYRNPGATSGARCIKPEFEAHPPAGAEGLMSLY